MILALRAERCFTGEEARVVRLMQLFADVDVGCRLEWLRSRAREALGKDVQVVEASSTEPSGSREVQEHRIRVSLSKPRPGASESAVGSIMAEFYLAETAADVRDEALDVLVQACDAAWEAGRSQAAFRSEAELAADDGPRPSSPIPRDVFMPSDVAAATDTPSTEATLGRGLDVRSQVLRPMDLGLLTRGVALPSLIHAPLDADARVRRRGVLVLGALAEQARSDGAIGPQLASLVNLLLVRHQWTPELAAAVAADAMEQAGASSAERAAPRDPWKRGSAGHTRVPGLLRAAAPWLLSGTRVQQLDLAGRAGSHAREEAVNAADELLRHAACPDQSNDAAVLAAGLIARLLARSLPDNDGSGAARLVSALANCVSSPRDGDVRSIGLRAAARIAATGDGNLAMVDWEGSSLWTSEGRLAKIVTAPV
ncbi:hypothetical protein FNF29_00232 [Cafeteria roenbergensis]|uniref:Uncharacterized protein n=1 Tax=Cafeteria roenbergensis TaxID=33653 RepID=A0A5A8CXB4_CAFRO|nr:hypothetical protein FNF29_00232 [Cafeteria roenbergensis]|eukprot:KAA0157656.1 hypothetical protein FNF29_00232 [Cafeteria roenbergensis]